MTGDCAADHASLADELRQYAGGALDMLEPLVDRIRNQPVDESAPEPDSCAGCPVCALLTVLRGGRSEMAVRLAEQVSGLLTVLRAALEEGAGPLGAEPPPRRRSAADRPDQTSTPAAEPAPDGGKVQRIRVLREADPVPEASSSAGSC